MHKNRAPENVNKQANGRVQGRERESNGELGKTISEGIEGKRLRKRRRESERKFKAAQATMLLAARIMCYMVFEMPSNESKVLCVSCRWAADYLFRSSEFLKLVCVHEQAAICLDLPCHK